MNHIDRQKPQKTGCLCFPGGSDGKASSYNAEDPGLIPGLGRSPGEGNGNPLKHSCLENPMDRGAWWSYSPWGHKESDMTNSFTFLYTQGTNTEGYCGTGRQDLAIISNQEAISKFTN